MNEPSGQPSPHPFALYDPDSSCWKTSLPSLLPANWPEQAVTWPRSGTWDLGAAYELQTSAHPTDASGSSSLLPTPDAGMFNDGQSVEVYRAGKERNSNIGGPPLAMAVQLLPTPDAAVFNDGQTVEAYEARKERERAKGYNGNGGGTPLAMAVQLLPTPEAKLAHSGPDYARMGRTESGGHDLTTAVWLLPTPQARDGDSTSRSMSATTAHRRHHEQGKRNLDDAIALLPTPAARDHKGLSARKPRTLADGTTSPDPCRNNQLPDAVALLPTPRATDGTNGGPNQRGSSGDLMLPSAVVQLLPTPTATDAKGPRRSTARTDAWTSNPGTTLTDAARSTGATTGQPSTSGPPSSDETHPPRLF